MPPERAALALVVDFFRRACGRWSPHWLLGLDGAPPRSRASRPREDVHLTRANAACTAGTVVVGDCTAAAATRPWACGGLGPTMVVTAALTATLAAARAATAITASVTALDAASPPAPSRQSPYGGGAAAGEGVLHTASGVWRCAVHTPEVPSQGAQ